MQEKKSMETCPICNSTFITETEHGFNKCLDCGAIVSIDEERSKTCTLNIEDAKCESCETNNQ